MIKEVKAQLAKCSADETEKIDALFTKLGELETEYLGYPVTKRPQIKQPAEQAWGKPFKPVDKDELGKHIKAMREEVAAANTNNGRTDRNQGTANEGKASQYAGVGRLTGAEQRMVGIPKRDNEPDIGALLEMKAEREARAKELAENTKPK